VQFASRNNIVYESFIKQKQKNNIDKNIYKIYKYFYIYNFTTTLHYVALSCKRKCVLEIWKKNALTTHIRLFSFLIDFDDYRFNFIYVFMY
jgi:hypothetical protein